MNCLICQSPTDKYLVATVLRKYEVTYTKCRSCGFIATETPYWLDEAYDSAITSLDIGLPRRNLHWMPVVEAIIRQWFVAGDAFLDYGGGYGLFVRLMRDQGFNFYRQDTYCANLFAKHFDISDYPDQTVFGMVTAFEVFEHLPDPLNSVEHMLSYSDNILFSTELQPGTNVTPATWWYFTPDTGQHVSLYTKESLSRLADQLGLRLYSDGQHLHMLTRERISEMWFKILARPSFAKVQNQLMPGRRETLLNSDFELVSQKVPILH